MFWLSQFLPPCDQYIPLHPFSDVIYQDSARFLNNSLWTIDPLPKQSQRGALFPLSVHLTFKEEHKLVVGFLVMWRRGPGQVSANFKTLYCLAREPRPWKHVMERYPKRLMTVSCSPARSFFLMLEFFFCLFLKHVDTYSFTVHEHNLFSKLN